MADFDGDTGDNTLTGTAGSDRLRGFAGNDKLIGNAGADILDGGDGEDTASYATATAAVKVNLVAGSEPNTGDAAGDTYVSIENLIGSDFGDYLAGNDANNKIWGGKGDDTLWGYAGSLNYLYGEDGADTLVGSSGKDVMDGGSGVDPLRFNGDTVSYQLSGAGVTASLLDQSVNTGDASGDVFIDMEDLTGTAHNDILYGDNGALNNLMGLAGNDQINGNGGKDIMIGGAGADRLDGGDGEDVADYETYRFEEFEHNGAPAGGVLGVTASLGNPSINTLDAAGDTYFNIENLAGSLLDDTLEGDGNANVILAWAGADTLRGMGGDDTLEGMPGADSIDGGTGQDTVSYNSAGTLVIPSWGFYTQVGAGVTASFANPSINTNDAKGDSYTNVENLLGSGFADVLEGDGNVNAIFGRDGNDELRGLGGNDTLVGGAGGDVINGGDGYDMASYAQSAVGVQVSLDGSTAATGEAVGDSFIAVEGLAGSDFNDVLTGDAAGNTLQGGKGDDVINGQAGDDTMVGGLGADTLNGGAGYDTVSYGQATSNVQVSLDGSISAFGEAIGDSFNSIEGVAGTDFNDVIFGDANANTLQGGLGNDNLNGKGGDDLIVGGIGADSMTGGDGRDTVSYETATAGVTVSLQNAALNTGDAAGDVLVGFEILQGSRLGDTLTGYDFAAVTIRGLEGDDKIFGGFADDVLIGDAGADELHGGEGYDLASYDTATSGVVANLAAPGGNTGDAAGDSYFGIENLAGTAFADTLSGNANDNIVLGGTGDDTLNGLAGNDGLEGGAGNDILAGGDGNDRLMGGVGNDTVRGDAGADVIFSDAGGDTIDGGADTDLLTYENSTSGITIVMGGAAGSGGDAQGDTVIGVENIIGSAFDDQITGDSGTNRLLGGAGNDRLVSGGGEDHLEGGAGGDIYDGTGGYTYVDYTTATTGVSAYLTWEAGGTGDAAGDRFTSVEGLVGTAYADVLSGSEVDNTIQSGDGNDWLFGWGGADYLVGGNGNDVLAGGLGNDLLDGGAGVDVASYRDAAASVFTVAGFGFKDGMVDGRSYGISLDLAKAVNNFGEAAYDQLNNVENLWGSRFDDVIRGADNVGGQVYGFEGNDILDGRGGDDVFYGGTGLDTITGGAGADDFFFLSYYDHTNVYGTVEPNEGGDTFTDFEHGVDHVTLSRYWFGFGNIGGPAAALTTANADFITNSTTATSSKPTLFWDTTARTLSFDADGTGASAAVLMGTFQAGVTLTLSDIWTA